MNIKRLIVVGLFLLAPASDTVAAFDAPGDTFVAAARIETGPAETVFPCPLVSKWFHCRPMGSHALS